MWRLVCVSATAAMLIILGETRLRASDYSNECRSADGVYVIDDGALYRASDTDRKQRMAYAIVEEQVLAENRSHCIPSNPQAQGAKFQNYFRKARQKLVIDEAGGTRSVTVVCELATSGLPAAFDCAREVKTLDKPNPGPVQGYTPATPGTWLHNGSVVKIEADGTQRRIVYMNPRKGLRDVGVSGDMTLFDGERSANTYSGTARWFSKACGEQRFAVTGMVSPDESRIELTGEAPRVDAACKVTGQRTERLVFERTR